MVIDRPQYMDKLISGMGSDQVKVVTGIRRCGKSFLIFNLFKSYLLSHGVPEDNIMEMAFDRYRNKKYQDPEVFYPYVANKLVRGKGTQYVFLDEVQLLGDFSGVLIDLIGMEDVDVYVTGSNARLLSKDVITEFTCRGQNVKMAPLSASLVPDDFL